MSHIFYTNGTPYKESEGACVEHDVVRLKGRGLAVQIAQGLSYLQEYAYLLVKWEGVSRVLLEVTFQD